jgi:hypothetical protein
MRTPRDTVPEAYLRASLSGLARYLRFPIIWLKVPTIMNLLFQRYRGPVTSRTAVAMGGIAFLNATRFLLFPIIFISYLNCLDTNRSRQDRYLAGVPADTTP